MIKGIYLTSYRAIFQLNFNFILIISTSRIIQWSNNGKFFQISSYSLFSFNLMDVQCPLNLCSFKILFKTQYQSCRRRALWRRCFLYIIQMIQPNLGNPGSLLSSRSNLWVSNVKFNSFFIFQNEHSLNSKQFVLSFFLEISNLGAQPIGKTDQGLELFPILCQLVI